MTEHNLAPIELTDDELLAVSGGIGEGVRFIRQPPFPRGSTKTSPSRSLAGTSLSVGGMAQPPFLMLPSQNRSRPQRAPLLPTLTTEARLPLTAEALELGA